MNQVLYCTTVTCKPALSGEGDTVSRNVYIVHQAMVWVVWSVVAGAGWCTALDTDTGRCCDDSCAANWGQCLQSPVVNK